MTPEANLEILLEDFLRLGIPGCALTVCHKGREIFSCEKGYADVSTKRTFRRSDVIRLFSNTKVFTVVALMTLFERGTFLLNDPLAKYLPEFEDIQVGCLSSNNSWTLRKPETPLRIRDCLIMSSGIPYNTCIDGRFANITHAALDAALQNLYQSGSFTCREFTKAIAQVPLLFDPGTSFAYGYSLDIIGALIEVLAGMDLEAYLQKAVLDPLGLKDTGFWMHPERAEKLIPLYEPSGSPNPVLEGPLQNLSMFMSGGGGLLSTLDDLTRFGSVLSTGGTLDGIRILGRKTIDLMRMNHLNTAQMHTFDLTKQTGWSFLEGYGYGLGVWTLLDPCAAGSSATPGQFGWNGAAGTCLFIDPAEQLSIAYAQQVLPNNYACACQPRMVNAAYSLL